jgi:type I restriction enzyme R subunit
MTQAALSREKLHTEEAVEVHLVSQLVARQGWTERLAEAYDRRHALDPDMLADYVRRTQPEAWAKLEGQYPGRTEAELVRQTRKRLDAVGTLEVLRTGLTIVPGIQISLCGFRPASGLNPDLQAAWEANNLGVMRQVRYSQASEKAIDVVLFVNGIPVATLELKNTLTGQTYADAQKQYRKDRSPAGEPLLSFRKGALVHFALDQELVTMTTELRNGATRFLPFNRGCDGGAGNPEVEGDFPIAYLYRDLDGERAVFSREVLLDILQHFCLVQEQETPSGKRKRVMIWPRFQQLDAVRKVVADARANGAGRNYLFQHSAGSGKSNTIAWTAHQLAKLHDANDEPVFHAVVIVTDRVVLDRQLQRTVESFSPAKGYVTPIDGTSRQLRDAITRGARIIISTIHKFSTETLSEVRNQKGRRFAIVIDEAHSSQSGKHADSMTRALGATPADAEQAEVEDVAAERAIDEKLMELQRLRGPSDNLSYLAFTATPRNVTLERFGTPAPDGKPRPFHLYSMRQAIEEGFILDVLRNYQTYDAYYRLESAIEDDPRLLERKSARKVARFANLHETALTKKAAVIVDHFRRHVLPELDREAKAMVVTSSREHAIRMQQAITGYIAQEGYDDVQALVAFSGEIESGGETFTEAAMNGFSETELPRRFDEGPWNVLVVAEKYQTGFDQPKLVAMYVDRHLKGLQAVQTLSRLNRTHPDKDRTFILDFRNTLDEIKEAFQPYYNVTGVEETTDPNEIYNLRARLMEKGVLERGEIDRFVERLLNARRAADERPHLEGIVREAVTRFRETLEEEDQEEFRQLLASFLRFYSFIAQVMRLEDTQLEQLHIYGSWLKRMLPSREAPEGHDVSDDMLQLSAFRLTAGDETKIELAPEEAGELSPIRDFGAGVYTPEEEKVLSEIIENFNARHGTTFTEGDFVRFREGADDVLNDSDMREMLGSNPAHDTYARFDREFFRRMISAFQRDGEMRNAFTQDPEARRMITELEHRRAVRLAREQVDQG